MLAGFDWSGRKCSSWSRCGRRAQYSFLFDSGIGYEPTLQLGHSGGAPKCTLEMRLFVLLRSAPWVFVFGRPHVVALPIREHMRHSRRGQPRRLLAVCNNCLRDLVDGTKKRCRSLVGVPLRPVGRRTVFTPPLRPVPGPFLGWASRTDARMGGLREMDT